MSALSSSSRRPLVTPDFHGDKGRENASPYGEFFRASSAASTNDINFRKVIGKTDEVGEETVYQVEIVNDELMRKARRSELASKKKCLTRRWQTALAAGLFIGALIAGISGMAYWLSIPKTITQPYLLYGESCYMNSRSCDETRSLWCPAGICICTSNYQWDSTLQNCTCGTNQTYNGFRCQGLGSYGDPCSTGTCKATLTCAPVINQTYTTGQAICDCDNATYLETVNATTLGQCVPKKPYNSTCLTKTDCQNWLGLICINTTGVARCECDTSVSYWDAITGKCASKVLGWDPCNATVPCDTSRGLTCLAGRCECNSVSFWDNVTTKYCQSLKTYAVACDYTFQCNTTANLSCPTNSSGCNCGSTSYPRMCDCQVGNFWDGLRCTAAHSFNGTCPGQYACTSNLVCYLGHCICPGNMIWNTPTVGACNCTTGTTWNNTVNTCA